MKVERLLDPKEIPDSLWDSSAGALVLPKALSEIYVQMIDAKGLRSLISRDGRDGPVGGIDKDSTDRHFAQAFDGSVARALLAVLDPRSQVGSTSNKFIRVTAGCDLALTDAPCGAGAASFAFLAALAELREKSILPRQPLYVKLVGAEPSEFAREYVISILEELRPTLESQAIFVEHHLCDWDVTCEFSTSDLIRASLTASQVGSARMLVVANFNGFLMQSGKLKAATPQLEELFRYATDDESFAIWIEPNMNRATAANGLLPVIYGLYAKLLSFFGFEDKELSFDKPLFQAEAKFWLPLQPDVHARVGLAVLPMSLRRGDQ